MKRNHLFSILAIVCTIFIVASCEEDSSPIGIGLQDPSTLYSGLHDTTLLTSAYTFYEDSLVTSGYTYGMIGYYNDPVFGLVEAAVYSQIAFPSSTGIVFDSCSTVDSVVVTLAISDLYPQRRHHKMHFEVCRLSEPLYTDSTYYSFSQAKTSNTCYFNGIVNVCDRDTVITLKLRNNIYSLFENASYTQEELQNALKGLRIRLIEDQEPSFVTVNFAGAGTKLTVYYKYTNNGETATETASFLIGMGAAHFNQFKHQYTGALSVFNSSHSDSISGQQYLYLEPMGGTNIKISMDNFVKSFAAQHPYAVIHYAELRLPLADIADNNPPDQLTMFKYDEEGTTFSIPDLYDPYRTSGFDGTYDKATNSYRIRITQHMQGLLRQGVDYGSLLLINSRRASAKRTVLNGLGSSNPPQITIVYTE